MPGSPPGQPQPGDQFIWGHTSKKGYGEHALSPGVIMHPDMRYIDMTDGALVTFLGNPNDQQHKQWALVGWTDANGTPRITSVDPGTFNSSFHAHNPGP